MSERPRILISRAPESRGLYEAAVERAGGEPISLYCPDPEMDFDALILGGGGDVDPVHIMEPNHGSYDIDPARDEAELALVSRCVYESKPILGICRGHQVVDIALGGSIYQDMNDRLLAIHALGPEGETRYHPLRVTTMTMLGDLYGQQILVNSTHHQAIHKFGQGLYGTAWDENGVVEAMQHGMLPIWTVQFHPEQLDGTNGTIDGQRIFDFFLERCRALGGR